MLNSPSIGHNEIGSSCLRSTHQRTRQLLHRAFTELLTEKSFEEITVHDIAERSTVNRATFYDHFSGQVRRAGGYHRRQLSSHARRADGRLKVEPARRVSNSSFVRSAISLPIWLLAVRSINDNSRL